MLLRRFFSATSLGLLTFTLGACSGEGADDAAVPTSTSATPTAETSSSRVGTTPEETLAERVPVSCQSGFGPVVTTWSDGTVGGWSQYCQDVLDAAVRSEAEASTPVCDGTVCRFPSGATMPDPAAPQIPTDTSGARCDDVQCVYPNGFVARIGDPNVPNYLKPGNSPWVQSQIDWVECLESGKTEEQCRAELN